MTTRKLALFLAAAMTAVFCAGGKPVPSDEIINIGSHRLQIHREGVGRPAVIIDAGIADPLEKLIPLQERMAGVTQVVTCSRAGYGKSEPGPMPRDAVREASELKALLEKASTRGSFVLVGHSLGALNMQVYASEYPDDVAGMILLDPPPLSFILGEEYRSLGATAESMTES